MMNKNNRKRQTARRASSASVIPNQFKKMLFGAGLLCLILFGFVFYVTQVHVAKMVFDPTSYDLGDVSVSKGIVTTRVTVKNTGDSNLIIDKIRTSCGCTEASLRAGTQVTAFYAMDHSPRPDAPGQLKFILEPGQEATLTIRYDPKVHPEFRGYATREVYLLSNSINGRGRSVKIDLKQVG